MNTTVPTAISLPRIESLPDDPAVLRGVVEQLLKLLTAANHKVENLQQQVEQLLRRAYGRSSEKWDPDQMLMDALMAHALEQRAELPKAEPVVATVKVDAHERKVTPHGRSLFPETLKHEEIIIPVPEAERICPVTGLERPVIGYEVSKKLDYRQAELTVKVYKREKRGGLGRDGRGDSTGEGQRGAAKRDGRWPDRACGGQQVRGPPAAVPAGEDFRTAGRQLEPQDDVRHIAGGGRAAGPVGGTD
jgi:hypothetical protein